MRLRFVAVSFFLIAISARASEVLQVVDEGAAALVSARKVGAWKEGDRACALRDAREIACGKVVRLLPQGAMVIFEGDRDPVAKGDVVLMVGDKRPLVGTPLISPSMHFASFPRFLISAGVALNFDYLRAVGNAIVGVTKYSALGVHLSAGREEDPGEAAYSEQTAILTINYFNRRGLQGLWAQVGAGIETFTLTSGGVSASGKVPTALAAFGWRNSFMKRISLGVIAGIQYADRRRAGNLIAFDDRFMPYLHADLGFHF